jgi:hypothetical protein
MRENDTMQINLPEIVAEVTRYVSEYERALAGNDLETIDKLFWNSPSTLRFGPNGTLIGHKAISDFRRARNIKGIERTITNSLITTFGTDFAVSNIESDRAGTTNRQSQTWVRMPEGWRIVSAHVSDGPAK